MTALCLFSSTISLSPLPAYPSASTQTSAVKRSTIAIHSCTAPKTSKPPHNLTKPSHQTPVIVALKSSCGATGTIHDGFVRCTGPAVLIEEIMSNPSGIPKDKHSDGSDSSILLHAATGTLVVEALLSYLPTWGASKYLYTRKKPLCLNSSLFCIPIFLTF